MNNSPKTLPEMIEAIKNKMAHDEGCAIYDEYMNRDCDCNLAKALSTADEAIRLARERPTREAVIDIIEAALRLRYDEKNRFAAEYIASLAGYPFPTPPAADDGQRTQGDK